MTESFCKGLKVKHFEYFEYSAVHSDRECGKEVRDTYNGSRGKGNNRKRRQQEAFRSVRLSSARLTTPEHLSALHKYYIHDAV